jgi:hypothetical protein
VQERNAVLGEKRCDLTEIRIVMSASDVLEHAHRNDAVERALCAAIIFERELHLRGESLRLGARTRQRKLRRGQGYAAHAHAARARQVERKSAPAATDVQNR